MNTNNINLDGIYSFEKEIYNDLCNAQITTSISGEWNFDNEVGQFKSFIETEYGNAIMLSDNNIATGGYGVQPSPLQYILFGLASGYASFITRKASIYNLLLDKLSVKIEADINYEPFFSIDEIAPIQGIKFIVDLVTDEDEKEIIKLKELPYDYCPELYVLDKNIHITVDFKIRNSIDILNEFQL